MQPHIQADTPQNRDKRRDVDLRAFALRQDGTSFDVTLLDISYDGCLLSSDEPFEMGERLRLIVRRRGVIDAQVRWIDSGKVGVRFASDLPA